MERNMSDDRETNTTEIKDAEQIRRHQPRAPRRRGTDVSSADMVHISESLEESVSVYEHNNYSGRQASHGYDDKPHIEAKSSYADDYDDSEVYKAKPRGTYAGKADRHAMPKQHDTERYAEPESGKAVGQEYTEYDGGTYGSNVSRQYEQSGNAGNKGDKKKKKKHPVLKLMLLLFICAAAFIGYKFITGQSGYYTVAVFGVDSRNGNTGKDALSDVNIIARIDRASGEIKLVSLYRDTYTKINSDGKYHKLNEAYFKGGPDQAIWAVEHNTDVKIDDYATFNWKAVADAINILGGVDLEITDKEFKYINAFITETVNSTGVGSVQLEHAGMNHLDGVQAVAYARLRLMDTDYQRTERQRKVIGLALDKAKNADYKTLATIIATVMPEISTSVTPDDLIPFARGIDRYYISETAGFPFDKQGMNIGKLDCVIPVTLESNAVKLHEFLYPDTPYMPSAELKSISDHIIDVTGLTG